MKKTNTNASFLEKLSTQFKSFYDGLDGSHRRMLWGALGLTLVGMVGVGYWANQTPYATLMAGGSYDDMVASTASLEELGIPYRMNASGTGLEVPTHMLGRARMVVQGSQLGEGGVDEPMPAMLTDKQQQHAFLRMKERSLARMINQFAPVNGSLVTVAPEEESLFLGEKRSATASVLVKLKPGASLSGEQIRSVVTIVAGGVEGLEPEGVTLTDDRGNLLYSGDQKRDGMLAGSGLLEHRVAMQRLYEGAIQTNLMKLLGSPTDFTVSVSVELDTSTAEIQTRKIDTESPALVSESVEESQTERTAAGGGVPGADANLPERIDEAAAADGGDKQNSEKSRIRSNYDFSTVQTTEVQTAGGISRISVSVQVNQARIAEILAVVGEQAPTQEAFESDVRKSISAAVGFSASRGDVLEVIFLPFAEIEMVEGTPETSAAALAAWSPYALAALGMVLTFGFVVRPLVGKIAQVPVPGGAESLSGEDAEAGAEPAAAEVEFGLADRLRLLVDNFEPVEAKDLNRLVDQQADAAAQVLRAWASGGKK